MKNKVIFLSGIPNSGKSTYAEKLSLKENAEIISSDNIREKLFGNSLTQKKPHLVFAEIYKQALKHLSKNKNVIIDSTNISRKRRLAWIKKFKDYQLECYCFITPYNSCIERNNKRKRKVDEFVLKDYFTSFSLPMMLEGWNNIYYIYSDSNLYHHLQERIELSITEQYNYEKLFQTLNVLPVFKNIYQFNQDNPHHAYSLCQHTYQALSYINEHYEDDDKLMMQYIALFHDVGKPFCKIFKNGNNHASYYGHENVSAQMAAYYLHNLGYSDSFIFKVTDIIQMHMNIWKAREDEEIASELYQLIGNESLWKLYFFGDADIFAKG